MNLAHSLSQLESFELVRRVFESATERDGLAYLFRHTLVHETAEDSLLKQERRRLNRMVAESLERLYPDRLDEFAARLAAHYDAAGDAAKTLEYSERAGDAAFRVFAKPEAIAQYTRALELAAGRPGTTPQQIR